jgi:hypothetical protein
MRTGWTGERPALGRRRRRRAQLQQANEAQRASALAVDARETRSGLSRPQRVGLPPIPRPARQPSPPSLPPSDAAGVDSRVDRRPLPRLNALDTALDLPLGMLVLPAAFRRRPPPLVLALGPLVALVLVLVASSAHVAGSLGRWTCRMSWMSPSYILLPGVEEPSDWAGRWRLYLYREQGWDGDQTVRPRVQLKPTTGHD